MKIDKEKLVSLFSYRNPQNNEQRKNDHIKVDKMYRELVLELADVITNPAELTTLLREVTKLRMLTNQSVVYKHEDINFKDIFVTEDDK